MSQKSEDSATQAKGQDASKTRKTGWATMESTSAFRAINFELFVRPNKFVMIVGAITFLSSIGYILFMNSRTDSKKTYVTLNEDGTMSSRPRVSKWD